MKSQFVYKHTSHVTKAVRSKVFDRSQKMRALSWQQII